MWQEKMEWMNCLRWNKFLLNMQTEKLLVSNSRWLEISAVAILLTVLGLLVFGTALGAWFTSEAWQLLEVGNDLGFARIWEQFVPHPENWYRPLTRLFFQVELSVFGFDPLGYRLVALALHIISACLLYSLAMLHLRSRTAACIVGIIFLLTLHAHEVIWDVGDLHTALGGVMLVVTVYAYALSKYKLALLFLALSLLADETGLLTCVLLIWYEICFNVPRWNRAMLLTSVRRVAPYGVLVVLYVLSRWFATNGIFLNETTPCHTPICLVNGMGEYLNRLVVRTDLLLSLVWRYRIVFSTIIGAALGIFIWLAKPWRWSDRQMLLFATGWTALASFFFVLALWPYVADRFWYVPDMGLALVVGTVAAHVQRAFPLLSLSKRVVVLSAASLLSAWVIVGAVMLVQRGQLWQRAGDEALFIVTRVQQLVPNPPPNPTFVFDVIPDSYYESFPPGNTGPYLYRNGLRSALRFRYGRSDVRVALAGSEEAHSATNPIYLSITQGHVELIATAP